MRRITILCMALAMSAFALSNCAYPDWEPEPSKGGSDEGNGSGLVIPAVTDFSVYASLAQTKSVITEEGALAWTAGDLINVFHGIAGEAELISDGVVFYNPKSEKPNEFLGKLGKELKKGYTYDWYIFYHRQTNGTWYSRQGCAEKIQVLPDGTIPQVEITSCGLNGGPLKGKGEYPAYIACHLFTDTPSVYVGGDRFPKIMQDGRDGDENPGYIGNMQNSATAGFKYFDCKDITEITIKVRGYTGGAFEVRTSWDGEVLATLPVINANVWEEYSAPVAIPDGIQSIYLTYRGGGNASLLSFELK